MMNDGRIRLFERDVLVGKEQKEEGKEVTGLNEDLFTLEEATQEGVLVTQIGEGVLVGFGVAYVDKRLRRAAVGS